jgi:hypothetical protein
MIILKRASIIFLSFIFLFNASKTFGQAELEPWGNLSGIRVDGELMNIESNLSVVKNDWANIVPTAKEAQRPKYSRNGKQQIVTTNIDSLYFSETVENVDKGIAKISVKVTSTIDQPLKGIYFSIFLPLDVSSSGTARINRQKPAPLSGSDLKLNQYFQNPASSISFLSMKRQIELTFAQPVSVTIKRSENEKVNGFRIYIPIHDGDIKKDIADTKSFSIKVSGVVRKAPVNLHVNTASTGNKFDGLGGNFRLQNAKTDPQVIDYCLDNLEVRWSRVEMPWQLWQPQINEDPMAQAKAGNINLHVQQSMEMAQRLSKKGIPVILSAWSAPAWAIVGKPKFRPGPDGVWGNPLDASKTNEIYKSIADYIVYLKEEYGVKISMFSFNESDLGINIRQTGEEHAQLIKGLGAYFETRGLDTKLLLGDNSDATTYTFIEPAMKDAATHRFIGAISFHSWRGWDKPTLQKWADAAAQLKKPLIVGEGSIDAQAWGYPAIFEEPVYALKEINLYTRLLAICQPESILQWQLTADYSLLSGGGIFGDNGPLRTTQRFWNLKQLGTKPAGLKAMPMESDASDISCAALGDKAKNEFAFHLVNNGPTREATLSGLPKTIHSLKIYITDQSKSMKKEQSILVKNGVAKFKLYQTSFTSLFSE